MKLKTEMRDGSPWLNGELCGHLVTSPVGPEDVARDVSYAHALVRAMDWYVQTARHGHVAEVAIALIQKRADETLAEWGYREE